MYQSGCTETEHIMSSQCTEVVHLYVPNWSLTCTEVVLYRSTEVVRPMYRNGHVPNWSSPSLVRWTVSFSAQVAG